MDEVKARSGWCDLVYVLMVIYVAVSLLLREVVGLVLVVVWKPLVCLFCNGAVSKICISTE